MFKSSVIITTHVLWNWNKSALGFSLLSVLSAEIEVIVLKEKKNNLHNFPFGVKPPIHQAELRSDTKVVLFKETSYFRFVVLVFWKILNAKGIYKIGNWRSIYKDYFEPKLDCI